jgi:PIN domain nuclease of toxin-antitoxin system
VKLILDTHTYLWAINEAEQLSVKAQEAIGDPANELFLSVASLWEATIKITIGKLHVPGNHVDFLITQLASTGVQVLPISPSHLRCLQTLPLHHRDPFDRVLIAQSEVEQMPIVTTDRDINLYPVKIIW